MNSKNESKKQLTRLEMADSLRISTCKNPHRVCMGNM